MYVHVDRANIVSYSSPFNPSKGQGPSIIGQPGLNGGRVSDQLQSVELPGAPRLGTMKLDVLIITSQPAGMLKNKRAVLNTHAQHV